MPRYISEEVLKERAQSLLAQRNEMLKDVDNLHVRIQRGNKKTGVNCWTVSLLPVVDCSNCAECSKDCYDLKSDLIYKGVVNDRCRNSAIHKADIARYWNEIDIQIKANFIRELRLNVGGDLNNDDFKYVAQLGANNPKTRILFFTKNYRGINKFLKKSSFPDNVFPILSAWQHVSMDNPYNLPCSHVLYEDGRTTAPQYGAIYCGGNCSECAFNGNGCWNLKHGEHVIFKVH